MFSRSSKIPVKFIISALFICTFHYVVIGEKFDFPKPNNNVNKADRDFLNNISTEEWEEFIKYGTDSVNKQKRLEETLLNSQITVEDGSLSHAQLLDTLPNSEAKEDNEIAKKILKSSQYVYYTKCMQHGIHGGDCEAYLMDKALPASSELMKECTKIVQSRRDGHHSFRRLLPRNYGDGFYEMYFEDKLPSPFVISSKGLNGRYSTLDDNDRSLALVQWTQFIEHDLSKPVVSSMSNGKPIECCNKENYKLLPRHRHPACAPLHGKNSEHKYGRETCLNYVRSALAVGSKCTFGEVEQLNQATGYLDLSQLYGFTVNAQHRMRSHKNGQLKSSTAAKLYQELLPMASGDLQAFCAFKPNTNNSRCFMAGDSRVNSNPFSIVLYTIFMRSHNQIASKLKLKYPKWDDDNLFEMAKSINTDIYRRIVFNEWLPAVVGDAFAAEINDVSPINKRTQNEVGNNFQISNEFAVAGIRFYFSMMPNSLRNFAVSKVEENGAFSVIVDNDVLPDPMIFILEDQIYKPDLIDTSAKLNLILESLLQQRAMKMDSAYEDSLIVNNFGSTRPTHSDILAFDIQRGRDHGLQGYVKYLEICSNVKINDWKDLESFITKEDISKLMSVYHSLDEIDLIVGGISETPLNNATVGPTFACILTEQFKKIRQWPHLTTSKSDESEEISNYKTITAAHVLCANSELRNVPKNIFQIPSKKNPLISCDDRLKEFR